MKIYFMEKFYKEGIEKNLLNISMVKLENVIESLKEKYEFKI